MTTSDYLEQLETDRQDLIDNLETMGIEDLTGDETFTELVPEVLNISAPIIQNNKSVIITSNTTTTITPDIGNDAMSVVQVTTNVPTGGSGNLFPFPSGINLRFGLSTNSDFSFMSQIDTSGQELMDYMFDSCTEMTTVPLFDTSSATAMDGMFFGCTSLVSVPAFDTSSAETMTAMFQDCSALTTVPLFDTSNVTTMVAIFDGCTELTTQSLDNILGMCADASSYNDPKELILLFGENDMSSYYPASTISSLSNYQDFINAGWVIGWD